MNCCEYRSFASRLIILGGLHWLIVLFDCKMAIEKQTLGIVVVCMQDLEFVFFR